MIYARIVAVGLLAICNVVSASENVAAGKLDDLRTVLNGYVRATAEEKSRQFWIYSLPYWTELGRSQ